MSGPRKVVALAAVAIGLVIAALQLATTGPVLRRLTFMPHHLPEEHRDAERWGLAADDIWIQVDDGPRLHAWWVPSTSTDSICGTVLHLHGNAGNIASRAPLGRGLAGRGYNVLLLDYRGYGASEGEPTERGLYQDAMAAHRFLVEDRGVPPEEFVLLAHSLGSAVATEVAKTRSVAAIALAAPFTSLPEAARARLRIVPRWLFDWEEGRFDALEDIPRIAAPVMVALGTEDGLVPSSSARALYAAASEPKEWVDVAGADHNGLFGDPEFMDRLDAFMRRHLGCGAGGPLDRQ